MLHETSMKRARNKKGVFKTAAVWCFLHNLISKTDSKGMNGITNFSDGVSRNLLALYTSIIRCYLLRKSHHNRNIRERSLIECIHRWLDWLCETDDNICCEYRIRWERWRSMRDRAKKFNVSLARRWRRLYQQRMFRSFNLITMLVFISRTYVGAWNFFALLLSKYAQESFSTSPEAIPRACSCYAKSL